MDLLYLLILFALSFTRAFVVVESETACGNLTYLEPAFQWRNVTFVFEPDNYQSDILPILKNEQYNMGGQRVSVSADPTRSVYLIVLNTYVGGRNYAGTYFSVTHNKCSSDRVRLDLRVISDCGYMYIRTKVVTVGGYVELGYFPALSVINKYHLYVRQWYNATSSSDMHLLDDYLSERKDPNWEFVLTIHNVNRWTSGNYSVRCTDDRPGRNKFTQPVEINVIGKPSLHSYNHTSECDDCLVGINGQDLGSHIYCHTTGGTVPTIYVGDRKVTVHFVSNDTYRPSYVASKDDHMKVVTCSVFNAAMATPLNTSSKLYVAVKPDNAVLAVPTLKEGEPAEITCSSKGGRPPSTLTLMIGTMNVTANASTTTILNEEFGSFTTQIVLEAAAKREWQTREVICSQRTPLFSSYKTEKEIIDCKYPPSEILLESPDMPSRLQDIYNLMFSCEIKDYNDNCRLEWTSNKPSLLEGIIPKEITNARSIRSIMNVSVTKEDLGKVLICNAVCSSFQRDISKSYALLVPSANTPVVPIDNEKRGVKETESASPLSWIAVAVGCLVLALVLGYVIVVRKRSQQNGRVNIPNESNNVQLGNVETGDASPFNENIQHAPCVPTKATDDGALVYADLDIKYLKESAANKNRSEGSDPVEYVDINFSAKALTSESKNV
ncbi:uncharacterized protein LOC128233534 isoform X3 [Mya arenaria]|uniref:uncharacterized protein LOC128233534 isoform X3 n=1 Tax=Mya arenaria TaxID=6604 RepID=UPI0022E834ED|nr:uncharacterized protein LOC128233534 isoform X3 [Mya arenaria]